MGQFTHLATPYPKGWANETVILHGLRKDPKYNNMKGTAKYQEYGDWLVEGNDWSIWVRPQNLSLDLMHRFKRGETARIDGFPGTSKDKVLNGLVGTVLWKTNEYLYVQMRKDDEDTWSQMLEKKGGLFMLHHKNVVKLDEYARKHRFQVGNKVEVCNKTLAGGNPMNDKEGLESLFRPEHPRQRLTDEDRDEKSTQQRDGRPKDYQEYENKDVMPVKPQPVTSDPGSKPSRVANSYQVEQEKRDAEIRNAAFEAEWQRRQAAVRQHEEPDHTQINLSGVRTCTHERAAADRVYDSDDQPHFRVPNAYHMEINKTANSVRRRLVAYRRQLKSRRSYLNARRRYLADRLRF